MTYKVLVCDRYTQDSLSYLSSHLDCEIVRSPSRIPPTDELHTADVLMVRSRTLIDRELLKKGRRLKLIITATSGFDHIDIRSCQEVGVAVMHTPEANKEGAAQLTLLLMLALQRKILSAHRSVLSHAWKEELPIGVELTEKEVGIIGFGRVGKRVAELCKAFGAKVSAYDPYVAEQDFSKLNISPLGLNEILRTSDVITLHAPLTSETKYIINRKTLDLMSEQTLIINAARGSLINEQDLIEALSQKKIGGAALDVFQKEPLPKDSALKNLENVIFAPHMGGYTEEAYSRASLEAAKKVIAYFKHQELSDRLPPDVSWFKNFEF